MWIDALSINQKDAKEKSREVRRMNQIYQAVDFVLVRISTDKSVNMNYVITLWRTTVGL